MPCGYTGLHGATLLRVISVGIRDLKNNFSRYVRRVVVGERVAVTDRGRVVAELVPAQRTQAHPSRHDELVAAGIIRSALERGDPFEHLPSLGLPSGTAAALIDDDRGE